LRISKLPFNLLNRYSNWYDAILRKKYFGIVKNQHLKITMYLLIFNVNIKIGHLLKIVVNLNLLVGR